MADERAAICAESEDNTSVKVYSVELGEEYEEEDDCYDEYGNYDYYGCNDLGCYGDDGEYYDDCDDAPNGGGGAARLLVTKPKRKLETDGNLNNHDLYEHASAED